MTASSSVPIELVENGPPVEVVLTTRQASALRESELVRIAPSFDAGTWSVSPRASVGVARVAGVELWIRPKLPVRRLFFLLGYAYELRGWRTDQIEVTTDTDLLPAVATAFARQAERAVEQGLLQGYRVTEETSPVLRGRIRTEEQYRRRYGLAVPLEVRYDDFTVDIPENRILRTAAERLLRLPRLPAFTRRALLRLVRLMADVEALGRGRPVPAWQPSRLNARYQPALRLGELILRGGSVEHEHGATVLDGFMLDLALLFEQFLTVALREALAPAGGRVVGQQRVHLDEERQILLKPDIVWHTRVGGEAVAVVDAKYKAEKPSGYPNADVYQMLAYCTRLGLPVGHLVYAEGNAEPTRHRLVGSGVEIIQHALDLDAEPAAVLAGAAKIAEALLANGHIRGVPATCAESARPVPVARDRPGRVACEARHPPNDSGRHGGGST